MGNRYSYIPWWDFYLCSLAVLLYRMYCTTSVRDVQVLLPVAHLLVMVTVLDESACSAVLFMWGRKEQSVPLFVVLLGSYLGSTEERSDYIVLFPMCLFTTGWAWIQGWGVKEYALCIRCIVGIRRVLSRCRASVSSLIYYFWFGGMKPEQKLKSCCSLSLTAVAVALEKFLCTAHWSS